MLRPETALEWREHRESVFSGFLWLSAGFWRGETALRASALTMLMAGCMVVQIGSQVAMNAWHRQFFDALEKKNLAGLGAAIGWLPLLILAAALAMSALIVSRMWLQTRWREWVTNRIAGWWIADQRYYRLGFVAPDQSAPEFRIAEDVRLAVEPLVDFVAGFASAAITAVAFATILWQVVGSFRLELCGRQIEVPAYMALAAVAYAALASAVIYLAGRRLVTGIAAKNEAEAQFRAELTRLRENAESIALVRGDADERAASKASFGRVVKAWLRVVRQQGVIGLVMNSNGAFLPILPLLLVTPKYLAGELSHGAVMQAVAAFAAVQGALMWFVDNFVRLAEWYASAARVNELTAALRELDAGTIMEDQTHITLGTSDDQAIHLDNLSIADRAGRTMVKEASVHIGRGEKVVVVGQSDMAESMLVRALAGLWSWGSGAIGLPEGASVAFVPQSPYLPLGSLRESLLYPVSSAVSNEAIASAMQRCGLRHLSDKLDETGIRWDQALSGGERQRLAFCRLLLHKPEIIVLDEATSALDPESQSSLLSLLGDELKSSTVISVGHASGLEAFHDRKIFLEKRQAGAHLLAPALPRKLWWLLRPNKESRT